MDCLSDETVLGLIQGALPPAEQESAHCHIAACPDCCGLVADTARSFFDDRPGADPSRPIGVAAPLDRTTPEVPSALGRAPAPPGLLAAGERVGRYVVLGVIGTGGMGTVYAAHDPGLNRRVALKMLRGESLSAEALRASQARLLREAQAMAQLSHPNVVAVYDVGTFGDRLFIAMEHVRGRTLREWIEARAPGSWREIAPVFLEAGRALAAAHAAGLVHRDFKPQNVLVGDDGRVRVTDFGLARAASAPGESGALAVRSSTGEAEPWEFGAAVTQTGMLIGTPAYMAPEQFLGRATDGRTDQFGYCVALFEALYRRRPFRSDSLEILVDAVTHGRLDPPPRAEGVPPAVARAVLRGLEVDRAARYSSMDALLTDLDDAPSVATSEPAAPLPPRAPVRAVPFLGLGAAVILAAFVVRWSQSEPATGVEATDVPSAPLQAASVVEERSVPADSSTPPAASAEVAATASASNRPSAPRATARAPGSRQGPRDAPQSAPRPGAPADEDALIKDLWRK